MKYLRFLLFSCLVFATFACDSGKPGIDSHVDSAATTTSTPNSATHNGEALNPERQALADRIAAFFDWYLQHQPELLGKRSAITPIDDDGFYIISPDALQAYGDYLFEAGFFSESFIKYDLGIWSQGCADEIAELRAEGYEADGPPPCVFEADPIFLTQDDITLFRDDILENGKLKSPASVTVTGRTGSYGFGSMAPVDMNWVLEDGVWKLARWPWMSESEEMP